MPDNIRYVYNPLTSQWEMEHIRGEPMPYQPRGQRIPAPYDPGEVRPLLTVEGARTYGVTFRAERYVLPEPEPTPDNSSGKPALASLIVLIMKQHSNPHLKWEKFGAGFAEAVWNTVPTFNPYTDVIIVNSPDRYEWQEFSYTHRYTRVDEAWTVTLTIDLTHVLDNDTLVLRNPRIT